MIIVPFGPKSKEWELRGGSICPEGCEPVAEFDDGTLAHDWLRLLKTEDLRVDALRKLVAGELSSPAVYRQTLEQVVKEVVRSLQTGRMHVHCASTRNRRKFYFLQTGSGSSQNKSQADSAPQPRRSVQTTSAPKKAAAPTEKAFLHADADEPAIATVLKSASANGTPFCEECMKAGMANA